MSREKKCLAAVIVNDHGHILPWTAESTKQACEDNAPRIFGSEDVWQKLKNLGAKVIQCEITLLED